jgi:hypothetical protein
VKAASANDHFPVSAYSRRKSERDENDLRMTLMRGVLRVGTMEREQLVKQLGSDYSDRRARA